MPSASTNYVFAQPTELEASSGHEQGRYKRLHSEIVKVDIIRVSNERQQPIQAVDFKDVS